VTARRSRASSWASGLFDSEADAERGFAQHFLYLREARRSFGIFRSLSAVEDIKIDGHATVQLSA